jgi:hypothetical protein
LPLGTEQGGPLPALGFLMAVGNRTGIRQDRLSTGRSGLTRGFLIPLCPFAVAFLTHQIEGFTTLC